mmetsp:Transcript_16856/g.27692  ORF Transcript_16856/g.27692 Transcript_16856/m.27692 type:complete len:90 (+) Transcript_16856:582-851(+)
MSNTHYTPINISVSGTLKGQPLQYFEDIYLLRLHQARTFALLLPTSVHDEDGGCWNSTPKYSCWANLCIPPSLKLLDAMKVDYSTHSTM